MKLNRKFIAILSIAVASVLTISTILYFTDASHRSGGKHSMNDSLNGQALIQVGATYITHTHLTAYKDNLAKSDAPLPDDSTLLKEMAAKELMLQLADEEGVAASLEEGPEGKAASGNAREPAATSARAAHAHAGCDGHQRRSVLGRLLPAGISGHAIDRTFLE